MKKQSLSLIFVALIGILFGGSVISMQAGAPILKELLRQQGEILKLQEGIKKRLDFVEDATVSAPFVKEKLESMMAEQQKLSILLGEQLKGLNKIITKASNRELYDFLKDSQKQEARKAKQKQEALKKYNIKIAHSPVIGDKNAPVTIIEFVDFQCPYSSRFYNPMVEAVKSFPPGKVNYLIKNFPLSFHPRAIPAAKAAFAAAEQGKYKEMVEALLKNNRDLSEEAFKKMAKEEGLNVKKFLKDYKEKDSQWEKYINEDKILGKNVGVRGTPTFFINGRKVNVGNVEGFKKAINDALEELKNSQKQ